MSLQDEDGNGAVKVERAACSYKNLSHKFKFDKKRDFKAQYSHIYFTRLQKMRKALHDSANRKWGGVRIIPISGLKDLSGNEKCCIVGTLFKDMELKPSILKEISQQHHLVPPPPRKKYIHKTDSLVLEDQGQRICLTGDILADELVTGVTIALLGCINDSGKFDVEEYCFAGEYPTVGVTISNGMDEVSSEDDQYIAIVSGLNVGSAHCDQLSLQLFIDYVTGVVGGAADSCSNIVRLILAGNSISDNPVKSSIAVKDSKTKYQAKNYEAQSTEAVKELDSVLTQLVSCLPVDVMPGSHDPTNHMLPQRPLHRCMFPQASRYPMLQCVTNPYQARVGGVSLLGTSGQNIDDVIRFSSYSDPMTILEHTLSWKHLAPTTPDTLSCFPYTTDDPFILDDCPQIYFAGNQPSLQHKIIEDTESGVRRAILTVPDFDQSHSCVLVNVKTLKCSEVQFRTSLHSLSPSVQRPGDTGDNMAAELSEEDINYMELYQDDADDDMD